MAATPGTPARPGASEEVMERLQDDVTRLTRALGVPPGRSLDGITTASVQMLSKMISRYDVTKARRTRRLRAAPVAGRARAPRGSPSPRLRTNSACGGVARRPRVSRALCRAARGLPRAARGRGVAA
jgi:hypothetical protein